jgi:tetratricopeptide (TPR) repeat protein
MHHRLPGRAWFCLRAHPRASTARNLKLRLGIVIAVVFIAQVTRVARAEPGGMSIQSDESAEYRERVDDALREFSVQNYEEARSLFLQAHALVPGARTLRALGLCEYELRNYSESIKYLEEALASHVKPLSGELRSETERVLARARTFVGRLALTVDPASARRVLDGAELEGREPLWLSMGEHTLELSASGYLSEKHKLNIKGGEDKKLNIALARADGMAGVQTKKDGPVSERRWYKSPWLWASLGVVVVGAGVTAAVLLTRDQGPSRDGGSTGRILQTN